MLEVKDLCKSYGSGFALMGINFKVEEGTIHGIIGENGSGKTTLMKCLIGIYKPASGEVLFEGNKVYDNPDVKKYIGYVADSNHYFIEYSVSDMVKFYKQTYDNFNEGLFIKYNTRFKLDMDSLVGGLSKGQNMKLAFMLNMAIKPKLIIMDEPTAGLDVIAKKEFFDILIDAVEKEKLTVIITSHHLEEMEKICDKITLIHDGREIFNDELVTFKEMFCKYQVIISKDAFNLIKSINGIVDVSNVGSIYTFILDRRCVNPEEIFRNAGATFIEKIDMSLESVFMYEILRQKRERI